MIRATAALLVVLAGTTARAEEPPADLAPGGDEVPAPGEPGPPPEGAEEGFDFGSPAGQGGAEEGFDFSTPADPSAPVGGAPEEEEELPSPWSMGGFLRSDWALAVERADTNPFAKARHSLDLDLRFHEGMVHLIWSGHAEWDAAYLYRRDDYDAPTLRAYEYQVDPREVLVAISPWHFELTVGRQIVGWGEGEMLSPLDVVNPRDFREPGLTELEDVRLPVFATRLGFFWEGHRAEVMVIHESFFGYRPAPFSPFSPIPALLDTISLPGQPPLSALLAGKEVRWRDLQDSIHIELQQLLVRWLWKGPGVDIGLYAGNVLDREGAVVLPNLTALDGLDKVYLFLDHLRYWLIGHSGNVPIGSAGLLVRWELVADLGRRYNVDLSTPAAPALGTAPGSMIHAMVSLRYTGLEHAIFVLELQKGFFIEEPDRVVLPVDAPALAFRGEYRLLRDDLRFTVGLLLFGFEVEYGWMLRGEVGYRFLDDLSATLGFVTYQPGSDLSLLSGLDRQDRLYLGLRWDFRLF